MFRRGNKKWPRKQLVRRDKVQDANQTRSHTLTGYSVRTPKQLQAPILRRLYQCWEAMLERHPRPGRQHFDPIEVPDLLPYLIMVDCHNDAKSFRIRLAGTEVVRWHGSEITGKYLQEVWLCGLLALEEEYRLAAMGLAPRYSSGQLENNLGLDQKVEHLLLPLSSDGEQTDRILGAVIFDKPRDLSMLDAPYLLASA